MHMIDETTGAPAIAFVGDTPWHKLGFAMPKGASLAEWAEKARINYDVIAAPVHYDVPGESALREFSGRKVLYRSDSKAPLAVVSNAFKVVQPAEILGFFDKLLAAGGYDMEVAGALSDGKRVWALAKVNDGAEVVDGDLVKAYLLAATSYDGTMATVIKFTGIRVVCNNTIQMSVGNASLGIKGEAIVDKGYLKSEVRVLHRDTFDADEVRLQLGIVNNAFERFIVRSRQLAGVSMGKVEADEFVAKLLEPYYTGEKDIRESRGYKRVIELFSGAAMGANFAPDSRWSMLNAVTELVDHERGRSDNSRLESAWFGTGNAIKNRALELLAA